MNKEQARIFLIKGKMYRFFALIFAFTGLLLFMYTYYEKSEGSFFVALSKPLNAAFIIFPFVPAVILSWMARSAEKKLHKFFSEPDE